MSSRIVISPQAAAHLLADSDYLSEHASLNVAFRFEDAVASELERLAKFPELDSPRPDANPQLPGLRMRRVEGFPNWLIYYLATDEAIEVLWILHGAEDRDHIVTES